MSSDEVGEAFGLKGRQVRNYVRLTELITELMEYVDQKKIPITLAVDISYFDKQIQQWVYEYIKDNGFLKPVQIAALKEQSNLVNTTQYHVRKLSKKEYSDRVVYLIHFNSK